MAVASCCVLRVVCVLLAALFFVCVCSCYALSVCVTYCPVFSDCGLLVCRLLRVICNLMY